MGFELILWLMLPLMGTIVVEYAMLLLLGERNGRVIRASVMMNVATNVPLNLALIVCSHSGWGHVAAGELIVLVVEMIWYWCVIRQWKRAAIYSVLCNAASFLVGLLIAVTSNFIW